MESLFSSPKTYSVKRGDTLYSIAFRYDTDFRTLAHLNHINPPYSLRVGQVINLQGIVPRHRQSRQRQTPAKRYYAAPQIRPSIITHLEIDTLVLLRDGCGL